MSNVWGELTVRWGEALSREAEVAMCEAGAEWIHDCISGQVAEAVWYQVAFPIKEELRS